MRRWTGSALLPDLQSTGFLGTNFSEIVIKIERLPLKIHLKMSAIFISEMEFYIHTWHVYRVEIYDIISIIQILPGNFVLNTPILIQWLVWGLSRFYPRPVLAFGYCHRLRLCLCPSVCVCVYQSLACPHNNLSAVQARITKFGSEMQNTLVKIPTKFYLILSLSAR